MTTDVRTDPRPTTRRPHAAGDGTDGSPLRIGLLSYRSKPHSGGQGVYVRNLSRELVALGHHVEVLSGQPYPTLDDGVVLCHVPSLDLYRDDDPFRTPPLREWRDAIDVLELAMMWSARFPEPLTFSLRAARELARRSGEFDVVHDNQSLGYGLLAVRRRATPVVATIHHPISIDRRIEVAQAATPRRRAALRRWYSFVRMQARVARRLDRILTVSRSSARDIERDFGVARGRLRAVPLGVDTEVFRPDAASARRPGAVVAVASADSPVKGVGTLVRAIAKLATERDVTLTVVGPRTPGGPVDRLIDDLAIAERVRFVGGLGEADVARELAGAEVAVVPSLHEGFSLPAIEAMACATPLVASGAGALPEVVGDDGAGTLVTPGDPEALAAAIGALLDDAEMRNAMGRRGRERVEERFTWRAAAEATVACYREAIANTSAAPKGDARTC